MFFTPWTHKKLEKISLIFTIFFSIQEDLKHAGNEKIFSLMSAKGPIGGFKENPTSVS